MAVKTFESSMAELEEVVARLEGGNVTLDESLSLFEKGIKLAGACQKKLDEAEKKVKILVSGENNEMDERDFSHNEK